MELVVLEKILDRLLSLGIYLASRWRHKQQKVSPHTNPELHRDFIFFLHFIECLFDDEQRWASSSIFCDISDICNLQTFLSILLKTLEEWKVYPIYLQLTITHLLFYIAHKSLKKYINVQFYRFLTKDWKIIQVTIRKIINFPDARKKNSIDKSLATASTFFSISCWWNSISGKILLR